MGVELDSLLDDPLRLRSVACRHSVGRFLPAWMVDLRAGLRIRRDPADGEGRLRSVPRPTSAEAISSLFTGYVRTRQFLADHQLRSEGALDAEPELRDYVGIPEVPPYVGLVCARVPL